MLEFRQLHYFVKVARKQHMTHAAEELHVAQSAVSRQIHLLEEQLGVKLFVHRGRNLQLTPAGKLFLNRAESILMHLQKAIQEIRELNQPEAGEIRFGFPNSLGIHLVPNVIAKFRKEYPNVKFRFKQGMSSKLTESLLKGEIDLALVSPLPDNLPQITGEVLLHEPLYAILPPDHMLAHLDSIRLRQLKDDPFILFNEGYSLRNIVWEACEKAGFTPKIGFEGEETDTIRGFVSTGMGVSLLPESSLVDGTPLRIAKLRVTEPKVSRQIGVVRRSGEKLPMVAEVFRRFLLEYPHI